MIRRRGLKDPWLLYHLYAFDGEVDLPRRYRFEPSELVMNDGRRFELLYSRRRMKMPASVVLDDFEVRSRIGGFTGETSSIRDWTSQLRFVKAGGGVSDPYRVHMNNPAESAVVFQSQWDPPIRLGVKMKSTVLGEPHGSCQPKRCVRTTARYHPHGQWSGVCILCEACDQATPFGSGKSGSRRSSMIRSILLLLALAWPVSANDLFLSQLQLDQLGTVAAFDQGRVKSLDSLAIGHEADHRSPEANRNHQPHRDVDLALRPEARRIGPPFMSKQTGPG